MGKARPRLSVVVTIVDGSATLERCLAGLAAQRNAPSLEVIVPWDSSVPGMREIAERFPTFSFPALGALETKRPISTPAGQHELYDRRRSAGLAAAAGDLVGILEDRGVPRPDWAETVSKLHESLGIAVIGGAVENGRNAMLNWAVYFCDFARYQLPFDAGPRDYVTDVNISYSRAAIEATRELWKERYHETTVNWALRRAGNELYLTPHLVVDELRDNLELGALLRERFEWGRLFAYTRAREDSWTRRLFHALLSPVLPFVMFARVARRQLGHNSTRSRFLIASPITFALLSWWSAGEFAGYVTGEP